MVFSRVDWPAEVDRERFPTVKAGLAAAIDKSVFPGVQGGPLMHVIAAKAVALHLAATEEFREDQRRTIANARALAATLADQGARLVSGGTDNHLMLVDVTPLGDDGPRGGADPRRDRDHREQERDPVRSPSAQHRVGDQDRNARDHEPRASAFRRWMRSGG